VGDESALTVMPAPGLDGRQKRSWPQHVLDRIAATGSGPACAAMVTLALQLLLHFCIILRQGASDQELELAAFALPGASYSMLLMIIQRGRGRPEWPIVILFGITSYVFTLFGVLVWLNFGRL
jgi:hypothetical protein